MARFIIPPEALDTYLSLTTQLIKRRDLKSMKRVRDRFSRKQFAEIMGMNVDRLIKLEKDWSQMTVAERTVIAYKLGITTEELEELI